MDAMLLLKATLLLSATLLAARLLRRAPAASRHWLWTVAFAAVLALPLLAVALPALYVPMPTGRLTNGADTVGEGRLTSRPYTVGEGRLTSGADTVGDGRLTSRPYTGNSPGFSRPSTRTLLLTVWVGGTLAAVAALLLGLIRVRRLVHTSEDMVDAAWTDAADALGARLGLRRPARLFVSPAVGTPMAGGVWRPAIYLPSSARDWSAEQRDVVLAHELAHLAGQDPLRHVAARLAVAFYWFHPLAWMAARQASAAREQACDEAVLALGTKPSAYARVLLDLASSLRPAPAGLAALPMIERSHLERRVMAILNNARPWGIGGASLRVPALALALCTLVVASMQPRVQASPVSVAIVTPPARPAASPAPASVAPASASALDATPVVMPPAALPAQVRDDSACTSEWRRGSNFNGWSDTRVIDGRTVVLRQVGTNGSESIIQDNFGDLRVCMVVEPAGPTTTGEKPSFWVGRAQRAVLETRRGNRTERLEVGPYGIGQRISWQVNGQDRSFDAAAQQWRDRMLATLDAIWEISRLRGQVSNLRGEISNIRGEESNLRGQISNYRGEVSNLRGQISNVRGEESNLRGEISNIRGHVSNLQGAISSERGSISNLRAGAYRLDDSAAVRDALKRHEDEIAKIEREIRAYDADAKVAAVEREIAKLDVEGKVAAIETEIRNFDLNGKIAAVEKQIAALDVNGKIANLEREILKLDVDRRVRELEKVRDDELKRLEAALAAIR